MELDKTLALVTGIILVLLAIVWIVLSVSLVYSLVRWDKIRKCLKSRWYNVRMYISILWEVYRDILPCWMVEYEDGTKTIALRREEAKCCENRWKCKGRRKIDWNYCKFRYGYFRGVKSNWKRT